MTITLLTELLYPFSNAPIPPDPGGGVHELVVSRALGPETSFWFNEFDVGFQTTDGKSK